MDIDPRLYVEIVPFEGRNAPVPHPVRDAGFDPSRAYKVLGTYNASETSECYFILANPDRAIWFIPQRHLRAWRLRDGDEFSVPKSDASSDRRVSGVLVSEGLPRNGSLPAARPAAL